MFTIVARNVDHALLEGICMLHQFGENISPRWVQTLEVTAPVTTTYLMPLERVLFNPVRDANPFFHAMEALWILAGRQDVEFLTQFNKRMADFSDNGEVFHAPYGYRLRHGADRYKVKDQFKEVVELFKKDINTRRAVLQIWDSMYDLNVDTKDTPCNDLIFLKVRDGKLNMTVCNRSNDMIWGAYGANIVQFSTIQEYLAAMIGVEVGVYNQVSDSFHVYPDNPQWTNLEAWGEMIDHSEYGVLSYEELNVTPYPLVTNVDSFDQELTIWFNDPENLHGRVYLNKYFEEVAVPMYSCWKLHKSHGSGLDLVECIKAEDWQLACKFWLERRESK